MSQEEKTNGSLSEDAMTKPEYFMPYGDATGSEGREPACARCIERFSFDVPQVEMLKMAVSLAVMAAHHEDAWLSELDDMRKDNYVDVASEFDPLVEELEQSAGLYCLSFMHIRVIYNCIRFAIGAEVISESQHELAMEMLARIRQFRTHLSNWHPDMKVSRHDTLFFDGQLTIEKAWSLAPKLRGKETGEIADVFKELRLECSKELRANRPTLHGERMPKSAVLETALDNAVAVIQAEANLWTKRWAYTTIEEDMYTLIDEVHRQVFLIDELLAMGCGSDRTNQRMYPDKELCSAMDDIQDLIDWDECPALMLKLKQIEPNWAKPMTIRDFQALGALAT